MIHYFDTLTGTIYTKAYSSTKPITNELYNIIIQEIIELALSRNISFRLRYKVSTHLNRYDTLYISINDTIIHFYPERITIYNPQLQYHNIPYIQFTTLKELVEKFGFCR